MTSRKEASELSQEGNCGCAKHNLWSKLQHMIDIVMNRGCVYQTAYYVCISQ